MPIEIRELVIRAQISEDGEGQPSTGDPGVKKHEIIEECVEQVLDILKRKEER
jgi:hypothetical protein